MKKAAKKVASAAKDKPTTISGLISIGAMLASLWAPPEYQSKIQQSIGILTAGGLIFGAVSPTKK